MSLSEAEASQAEKRGATERVIASLGLRNGSAQRVLESLESGPAGTFIPNVAGLDVYAPDPDNDLASVLRNDLAAGKHVAMTLSLRTSLGRETFKLSESESAAYLTGTIDDRQGITGLRVAERHLEIARGAADRVKEASAHELICLQEVGAFDRRRRVKPIDQWAVREVAPLTGDTITRANRPFLPGLGTGDYPNERTMQYGSQVQQMLINDVWDEQAKCRYAYAHDPVCKRAVNAKTDYVLGRGVKVIAAHPKVQAVLDESDFRLDFQKTFKRWINSCHVMGELIVRYQPIGDGKLDAKKIPAQTIWEIWTDAEDANAATKYIQRYRTRYQMFNPDPNVIQFINREIDADEINHVKFNADEDEVRGRGEPYAALMWHEKFRSIWDAVTEKEFASAAFHYAAKVQGTAADVQNFIASSVPKGRARPGGWMVYNDKVDDIKAIASGVTGAPAGNGSVNDGLLNIIAANYGLSKEHLGVSGNRTRSGAQVAQGPAEKSFESRQDDIGFFLREHYERIIDEAQTNGGVKDDEADEFLDLDGVEDFTFKIQFPAIIKADSATRIGNLQIGRSNSYISQRSGSEVWAGEMDLGDQYDYDAEQVQIKAEEALGIFPPGINPKADPGDIAKPQGGIGASGPQTGDKADTTSITIKQQTGTANANNPTGAVGQANNRAADANAKESLRHAAYRLSEAGAIVIFK